MIITFNGKINTADAEEDKVFKALKEFMNDNFQNFEFEVSGVNKTLKDEWHKSKEEELKTGIIHPDAITKINNPTEQTKI